MWMRLDSGRFPQMNYNRVIRQAKSRVHPDARPTFGITRSQVYAGWLSHNLPCANPPTGRRDTD